MIKSRFSPAVFLGLIIVLALAVLPQTIAYAAAFTAVQSGPWNTPATWGGSVPASSDSLTIPAGITVDFSGYTNDGGILIQPGGAVTNSGTFINSSTITNNGTITNTGTINNTGTITNLGVINTFCPVSLNGTILGGGQIIYHCTTPVCLPLTADSVVGNMPGTTQAYWAPGQISPGVVISPGTYWVLGEDSSGKYYEILLSCQYLWVPVDSMQPSFQAPWSGQPLPTTNVEG